MMVVMEQRHPGNMNVAMANLASALAIVADEYDKGHLGHDDWHRIRAARQSIEEAINCVRPYCTSIEAGG